MTDEPAKLYAIYSQHQTNMARQLQPAQPSVFEYLKPGSKMTVHVTAVSTMPGCPEYLFADKIDHGEVIRFLRIVK